MKIIPNTDFEDNKIQSKDLKVGDLIVTPYSNPEDYEHENKQFEVLIYLGSSIKYSLFHPRPTMILYNFKTKEKTDRTISFGNGYSLLLNEDKEDKE